MCLFNKKAYLKGYLIKKENKVLKNIDKSSDE